MSELITMKSEALGADTAVKVTKPETGLPDKILLLLHGDIYPECEFSVIENLPEELSLGELCEKYRLLAAIPYMKNRYYISTEDYNCERFIAEELPAMFRERYGLSKEAEAILGGISMGGYGASLIGANSGAFRKIISISGAYITNDIIIGNPEVWGDRMPVPGSVKGSYLQYFLPLGSLEGSRERNVEAALDELSRGRNTAVFVLSCGDEDWLYERNLRFIERLKEDNISYTFDKIPGGGHDSLCFKEGLWKVMERIF